MAAGTFSKLLILCLFLTLVSVVVGTLGESGSALDRNRRTTGLLNFVHRTVDSALHHLDNLHPNYNYNPPGHFRWRRTATSAAPSSTLRGGNRRNRRPRGRGQRFSRRRLRHRGGQRRKSRSLDQVLLDRQFFRSISNPRGNSRIRGLSRFSAGHGTNRNLGLRNHRLFSRSAVVTPLEQRDLDLSGDLSRQRRTVSRIRGLLQSQGLMKRSLLEGNATYRMGQFIQHRAKENGGTEGIPYVLVPEVEMDGGPLRRKKRTTHHFARLFNWLFDGNNHQEEPRHWYRGRYYVQPKYQESLAGTPCQCCGDSDPVEVADCGNIPEEIIEFEEFPQETVEFEEFPQETVEFEEFPPEREVQDEFPPEKEEPNFEEYPTKHTFFDKDEGKESYYEDEEEVQSFEDFEQQEESQLEEDEENSLQSHFEDFDQGNREENQLETIPGSFEIPVVQLN